MGAATVGYRSKRRVNGWDCPPHPFQFVAWFCVIYFTVGHFTTIVPALLSPWQPAAYIILGVVFVVQFVVHILAVTIDPSDPNILTAQKDTKRCVPTLDRTRHKHVIENMHCYLCEADVGPKSKHCSVCNKCVAHFDHHCKWLNNCVGSKNYRFFIATLVSCLAGLVILFALSLMQFIAYYTDKNHGNILQPYKDVVDAAESYSNVYAETTPHTLPHSGANFSISPAEETTVPGQNLEAVFKIMYIAVPDVGWQIWTGIYFVLALVGACLLAHLFSFHIYLMCKGFSTYDYIVLERERAEQTARDKEVEEGSVNRAKQKVNRIAPQTADELELKSEQVTSRSAECFTGGRENAYAEDATPPSSVPTPPPPLRAHSPPFRQQNHIAPEHEWHHNHQASHTQQNKSQSTKTEQSSSGSKEDTVHKPKKKRKRKKRPSEFDMNNDLPPGYLVNHIPLPSTEIIPTFEDMQDLEAAIARTHPAQLDNDSGLGPGSLSDVAVAMQPKSATLPHNASNTKGTAAVWSRDSSDDDDTLGEQHSSMYSENSSPADMRRSASMLGLSGSPEKEIFPRVKVERLQLPNSSDSETEATRKPSKNDLVYKSRGYEARLQAVQPPFHMNTPGYNIQAAGPVAEYDSDSAESLREIPICDTRLGSLYCTSPRYKQSANGRNSVAKQRSTTGDQTLPRTRKKRRRAAKSTAVSSSGLSNCNLAYDSHGDSYTVVRDSPRSEPPKRHKDVPPLDLSSLGEDDGDLRKHVSQI